MNELEIFVAWDIGDATHRPRLPGPIEPIDRDTLDEITGGLEDIDELPTIYTFAHKPLSEFAVRVFLPDGRVYPYDNEIWLELVLEKKEPESGQWVRTTNKCKDGTDLLLFDSRDVEQKTATRSHGGANGRQRSVTMADDFNRNADGTDKSVQYGIVKRDEGRGRVAYAWWPAGMRIREPGEYRLVVRPTNPKVREFVGRLGNGPAPDRQLDNYHMRFRVPQSYKREADDDEEPPEASGPGANQDSEPWSPGRCCCSS